MATTEQALDWIRSHGVSERSFGGALEKFFKTQANRIARQAESFHGLTPETAKVLFRADDEHARMMGIVRRNLWYLGMQAAEEALRPLTDSKSFTDEPWYKPDSYFGQVPDDVRQAVLAQMREMSKQPYWRRIQDEVFSDLTAVIEQGIADEVSLSALAKRIRFELGEERGGKRARLIARTETTGALNAGHHAAMGHLAQAGILTGKEWASLLDQDTRQSHVDLNGQQVSAGADFTVGGYAAPFPGHWSLPAAERANCRCTVLSVLAV